MAASATRRPPASAGADSFSFKANDGTVDSNTATVGITVTAVNQAPVANDGVLTVNQDTSNDGRHPGGERRGRQTT